MIESEEQWFDGREGWDTFFFTFYGNEACKVNTSQKFA